MNNRQDSPGCFRQRLVSNFNKGRRLFPRQTIDLSNDDAAAMFVTLAPSLSLDTRTQLPKAR